MRHSPQPMPMPIPPMEIKEMPQRHVHAGSVLERARLRPRARKQPQSRRLHRPSSRSLRLAKQHGLLVHNPSNDRTTGHKSLPLSRILMRRELRPRRTKARAQRTSRESNGNRVCFIEHHAYAYLFIPFPNLLQTKWIWLLQVSFTTTYFLSPQLYCCSWHRIEEVQERKGDVSAHDR